MARGIAQAGAIRGRGVASLGAKVSQGIGEGMAKWEQNKAILANNSGKIDGYLAALQQDPSGVEVTQDMERMIKNYTEGKLNVNETSRLVTSFDTAAKAGQAKRDQEFRKAQMAEMAANTRLRDANALAAGQPDVPDPANGIRYPSRETAEADLLNRNQTGTIYQEANGGWIATGVRPNSERPAFRSAKDDALAAELTILSKSAAEFNEALINDATSSTRRTAELTKALDLLKTVKTGTGSELILKGKKIADRLNFDVDLESVANAEQLQVLFGNEMMGRIQETKGSVSDKEMDKFADISPDLSKSNEGNRLIINFALAVEKRKPKLAKYMTSLRREGKTEREVRNAIDDWLNLPENSLLETLYAPDSLVPNSGPIDPIDALINDNS